MYPLKTKGFITYEPTRNMQGKSEWWLTIELPYFSDTAKMYRWFIGREWYLADQCHGKKRAYSKPPHHYHISIIRGEKPRANLDQWGKYKANEKVNVEYSNEIRQTSIARDGKDHFWFVEAFYEYYVEMRKFYGLNYQRHGADFKGHITVARAF